MTDLAEVRAKLRSEAQALAVQHPSVPLRVGKLCKELRIKIIQSNDVRGLGAYMYFTGKFAAEPEIRLPRFVASKAYARFCVAHEIGHFLIFKHFGHIPRGESDYWQHEALCDEFARNLLVPRELTRKILKSVDLSQTYLLGIVRDIAQTAQVPWSQAAYSVSECCETHFLKAKPAGESFKINFSTLPDKSEYGRVLNRFSRIGRMCIRAPSTCIIHEHLDRSELIHARLKRFSGSEYIIEAQARGDEVLLAVRPAGIVMRDMPPKLFSSTCLHMPSQD